MSKNKKLCLRLVREGESHVTAEQVWEAARKEVPGIVMATVYNNLNALAAEGLISRVQIANTKDRYDRTLSPHFHLVCDRCGSMRDLMELPVPTEQMDLLLEGDRYSLELIAHHICKSCQEAPL